jgi:hypothetical protein
MGHNADPKMVAAILANSDLLADDEEARRQGEEHQPPISIAMATCVAAAPSSGIWPSMNQHDLPDSTPFCETF